jgi:hypothetical protein
MDDKRSQNGIASLRPISKWRRWRSPSCSYLKKDQKRIDGLSLQ